MLIRKLRDHDCKVMFDKTSIIETLDDKKIMMGDRPSYRPSDLNIK